MQSGAPVPRSLIDGATRFLGWWRDELRGLLPERGLAVFAGPERTAVLTHVEGGFQITEAGAGRRQAGAAGQAPVISRAQALSKLADMAEAGTATAAGIRVPLSQCFVRRVELPAAARSDVRQILNFDLERATPFRLKDVYTAHVVEGEAGGKGKLRVSQMVAKREAIDPLVADVEATGLEVAFVDCWQDQPSAGLGVDFLEQSAPEAAAQGLVTAPRALAALALVLALSAVAIILSRHESALEDVQARAAKMRAQAATVRGVLERSDAAVADLARLQQMKLKQIPAIEVLEEVTRVLPDSVWLTDLRMEGDTLDISGLAKSGAALLSLFERSAIFADAALTAPLTLDQREDKERFSLRIRIKQPMASRPLAKEEQQ
jgi:general secretion pathway protein L